MLLNHTLMWCFTGGPGNLVMDPSGTDSRQCRQINGQFPAFLSGALDTETSPCCCWQPSPGSVSPLRRAAHFSAARKQALLFIGRGREGGREGGGGGEEGGRCCGDTERERERERERWSQYSGMCLGKPRVDTAQMRESLAEGSRGNPFNTSIPPSLPPFFSPTPPFPFRLSCQPPVSDIKTLHKRGGTVMGKRLMSD